MKISILYDSQTGNTKMLADTINDSLRGLVDILFYGNAADAGSYEIGDSDIIFLGFWTDKGQCSDKLKVVLPKLCGKKIVLFGTAGFEGSEEYFQKILSGVESALPRIARWQELICVRAGCQCLFESDMKECRQKVCLRQIP